MNQGTQNRNSKMNSCDCISQEFVISDVRLAQAYIPYQFLCKLFNPVDSLKTGTAFPELYSPFEVDNVKNNKCK